MMYRTSELSGARLDQAVAKACGYLYDKNIDDDFVVTFLDQAVVPRPPEHVHREACRIVIEGQERSFCPSSEWSHGGPIIEREGISVYKDGVDSLTWCAFVGDNEWPHRAERPLVAAMRAFVDDRLGAQVEL